MAVQDISLEDLRKECRMGKNVAYLFSDRSKALAKAIVLKKARRHSYYVYGKIKYMISQKSYIKTPHGGGGLDGN